MTGHLKSLGLIFTGHGRDGALTVSKGFPT